MNIPGATFWRNAACLILFGGTLLLFSRTVNHDFLDCDDPDYVTQNSHVQAGLTMDGMRWAFTSGAAANWHPLTWLSHMLDSQIFGAGPRGPHATNVVLHALNAVLAFLVLRKLTGSFWAAAFNAALFAWHPLRVESVAWVAERKDLLCGFFGLAAIWAYATYAERRREGKPAGAFFAMTCLAFLLGLLSKPMLVTLPGLLLVLDWWPLRRFGTETPRRLVLEKTPLLVLSAVSCVVTLAVQKQGGAMVGTFPFPERIANAAISVTGYLENFFWPVNLAIGYPHAQSIPMVAAIGPMVVAAGLTFLFFQQRRRCPWLLAGWLWFLGMLVPVLGLVQVGTQAMADRYTYLPMIGIQLVLFGLMAEVKWPMQWARPAMAVCILFLLATRTWGQEAFWKNSRTLYGHALAVTQGNYLAESYLGATCFNAGQIEAARDHFENAVELKPDFVTARVRLGISWERLGRVDKALAAYRAVLNDHPDNFEAQLHCAGALAFLNHNAEALAHYAAAIRIDPRSASAHSGLADSLRALGRLPEAGGEYRAALALKPDDAFAYFGLAAALEDTNATEALADYLKAAQLKPDYAEAEYDAGVLLLNRGQAADAAAHFKRALQIQPANAPAQAGLKLAEEQAKPPEPQLVTVNQDMK